MAVDMNVVVVCDALANSNVRVKLHNPSTVKCQEGKNKYRQELGGKYVFLRFFSLL